MVKNEASENEQFGRGQFTEKRVDLARYSLCKT